MPNWRESRLFIALSFLALGFGGSSAFFITYVIPIYQKQDSNTINELNTKINNTNKSHANNINSLNETIGSQSKKINELQRNETNLSNEIINYKNQLLSISNLSAFQHGQPLPIGYSSILPGMNLSGVESKYNKEKLEIGPRKNT